MFTTPTAFFWLWILPALGGVLLIQSIRSRRTVEKVAGPNARDAIRASQLPGTGILRWILAMCGLALLILALAGPAWDPVEETIQRQGRDVVFLVDVSKSMLADDLRPNRLERARYEIEECVSTFSGDRVALVAFAGDNAVLCPLTQEQLSYAMFPIGDLLKSEVRRLAHEADLQSADKKDSQGICFVGKVDLPTFLQQKLKPKEGDVIEVYDSYFTDNQQYKFIHDTLDSILADNDGSLNMITRYISEDKAKPSHERREKGGPMPVSPFSAEKIAMMTDEELEKLSEPVRYEIEFETETYRSGKKHVKKTRYKDNPFGKIVGKHDGAQFYTIGQRKGLNIGGHKDSIFVIGTDIEKNIIYVGEGHTHKGLSRSCLRVLPEEIHWIREDMKMGIGEIRRYRVRIRYRQPLQDATLVMRQNGLFIIFDEPQRGITPGQFAAWYSPIKDGSEVSTCETSVEMIGSGVI